jgi:uncharacterized membrane protein YgcG
MARKIPGPLCLGLVLLILFPIAGSFAQSGKIFLPKDFSDRILKLHSEISIDKDGDLHVKEFIKIFNGDGENTPGFDKASFSFNNDIQRGLVRDFPTSYKDTNGYWAKTGFEIEGVYKNGSREPYETENLTNGTRIIIGDKDIVLAPGVYEYRIEYKSNRQLIFHENKDELYWNVNGNGWVFTADTVSCAVHFPEGANITEHACYTGPQGSTDSKCKAELINGNTISFVNNERLNSYEGLTIAASIQKGIISPPSSFSNAIAFLRANYIIPLLGFLFLFLSGYYFFVWHRKGRDPKKGIVYPQFSPPADLTPADVGYIVEQEYGSHLFAAALVDCAVKKQLNIEVSREGLIIKTNVYNFNRPEGTNHIPSTRNTYGFDLETLYGEKAQRGKYNATLRSCYQSLHDALKERFLIRGGKKNKWYGLFALNRGYITFGLIVFIASVFFSFQFLVTHPTLKLLVICVCFLLAMLIVHIVFAKIMSSYSKRGRDIADHLLGFKMYLEQAERHVYNQLAPPEKTLDLFEKYLPYAIALQVENDWAASFDSIVQKAIEEGYRPTYYSMRNGSLNTLSVSDMSRGISSGLSNTISSASTPPSSSRGGSSGGGSSGGGGGGGGGGGW